MKFSTETVPCALCASTASRVRFASMEGWPDSAAHHFEATTDKFGAYGTVRECDACGLVYTSPRVKAEQLLDGYAGTEDTAYLEESESRSMNAYLSLARLRRWVKGGRLLEIGCYAGYFLNAARLNFEVVGVEPSHWAARYAREQLRLDVPAATLAAARFPDASFDAVAMIDVIEHLSDPVGAVRDVRRLLKPGGAFYVVTPDIDSLSARILGGRWWGLRPAHIYYFSRGTLRRLLEDNGFEVVDSRSYGRIFTWQYWLSRLSNYPRPIYLAVEAVMRLFGVEDKFLYLDTRDTVQMIARAR